MTPFVLTIVFLVGTVLIVEFALWRMFRRRIDPLVFPAEADASQVGFFSTNRMRAVAIVHTLVLAAWTVFTIFWLW